MPSYKFDSESDSDADEATKLPARAPVLSDEDDEPGPDDTFQFRHSFSKAPRPHNAHSYRPPTADDDELIIDEPSFQTDQGGEYEEPSFNEMQQDGSYYDDGAEDEKEGASFYSEEGFEDEDEEAEYGGDPLAATVRIERHATWLEQIDSTDLAVKRLNAIDGREKMLTTRVHWGGRTPEVKYSTEDLERDLFGETVKTKKKSEFDYLQAEALRQGIFDQKSWDEKEEEKRKPNPAFRIRWGPGDLLIHQPAVRTKTLNEASLSLTKLHLSAFENDAAEKQAQKLLERQIEHTTFSTDRSGIPIATPASSLQFSSFFDTLSLHSGPISPIDEYESHLWHLASILFDDLPQTVPPSNQQPHRKRQLSSFFKDLVSRSVWNDTSKTRDPAERIFLNLTGYRFNDACADATKSKDLHLATLISLAEASPESFRRDLARQVEVWGKDDSARDIQVWYRATYEVLAGQIDGGNKGYGVSALSQVGIGKRMDWRRAFAMRLWFGIPAEGEIKDAVTEYWMACQQDPSIQKPLPWYAAQGPGAPSGIYDGLFQLLKLYSGTGLNRTLDMPLNPYNFSPAAPDVRVPWHLYIILSQLKGEASFADSFGSKGKAISDTGERLTLSYVNQLEQLGLWQWAIFVALHLGRENTRKGVITDILARHISSITNETEEKGIISKLVDSWKIPMEWILEAKALYARSQGDHHLCAKNLILAKSFSEAQKTILAHIAPQAIISTHITPLEDLLFLFDTAHPPSGWDIGGQVYLDYLSLDPAAAERRRRASGSRRDIVVRLLRALPSMEARTFEQRVAQSEMARVVANLIVSSSEFSREVSGVMRLPLLEGDALRITRKIAGGMFEHILSA